MRDLEQLPNFPEGEVAILGAMLLDNKVIPQVISLVSPSDLYSSANRTVFKAIISLYNDGVGADWATLAERLTAKGELNSVGGHEFLVTLADAVPSTANISHYIGAVKEKSQRRQLINIIREGVQDLYDADKGLEETRADLQSALVKAVSGGGSQTLHISDVIREHIKVLEAITQKGQDPGLLTHFSAIDRNTGGFGDQDLVILCARPSMGKTALATQIALNAATANDNKFVVIFSLEMGRVSVSSRLISAFSGVGLRSIRQGPLSRKSLSTLMDAFSRLSDHALWLDDSSSTTPMDVYTRTAQIASATGKTPALVVVDYLQIMKPSKAHTSREREVATIATDLKRAAKQLNCPVLLLSQLNRECEKRTLPERRPRLSDLRESGGIEQDADIVLGLFRLGYYAERGQDGVADTPENRGHAECITLKNRNGPVGGGKLWWRAETSSFHSISQFNTFEQPEEDQANLDVF